MNVTLWWRLLLTSVVLMMPVTLKASEFGASIETAQWHLDPSPLECRLWQQVPNYGEVVFLRKSGQDLQFYIESERAAIFAGEAEIKVIAPLWRTGITDELIATVKLRKGNRPLILDDEWANWFLDELYEGMNPAIVLSGWHNKKKLRVDVSPVNFQDAYAGYLSCVAGLFPSNFDKLRHSTLNYRTDKWRLRGTLLKRLDMVVRYIELDAEVEHIYVDGYADNEGRRGHNWELSRLRARAVQRYLEYSGVDPSMITMRYHGETRPLVRNSNRSNKAKNRRVFVQLVKTEAWNQKT